MPPAVPPVVEGAPTEPPLPWPARWGMLLPWPMVGAMPWGLRSAEGSAPNGLIGGATCSAPPTAIASLALAWWGWEWEDAAGWGAGWS